MEIAIKAGHHEQLLEELGAFGQRVEFAAARAAGDEEIAGAAGRVFDEEGRLQFEKAILGEVFARQLVDPGARHQHALHRGAPQVEVAVGQARRLLRVDLVLDDKRQRLGTVEDLQPCRVDLDFAGLHLGIDVAATRVDHAAHADDVFEAQAAGELMRHRVKAGLKHHLGDAHAVAQIDEDGLAVVAPTVDPAEENDLFAHVSSGQFAAGMGALHLVDHLAHETCSSRAGAAMDADQKKGACQNAPETSGGSKKGRLIGARSIPVNGQWPP